jgi:tetratricopeptide (TPR) repeat protein
MNAQKLLGRMRNWIEHEPVMRLEADEAGEEFFAFHEYDPDMPDKATLTGLFVEWFTYDRKTTRYLKTPAEVFLRYGARGLKKAEKEFYKTLSRTVFGMFEVLATDPEAGRVRVRRLDGAGEWEVRDMLGSRGMKAGNVLFARIIPLPDQPVFTGWVAGLPGGAAEIKELLGRHFDSPDKISGLKPRYLLGLWARQVNWMSKGEFFCRARLAGIWQRWCGAGKPFSAVEAAVDQGDYDGYLAAQKVLFENCPDPELLREITGLLEAWWNLASGSKAGLKPPAELAGPGPGPVELRYVRLLGNASFARYEKTGKEFSREESDEWLRGAANGEGGRSPYELIVDERKSRSHPYPEKVAYSMRVQGIENKASKPAFDTVQAALELMMRKDFSGAARLYEAALAVLRHDKSVSFRVLGNLGICYALLGERGKAVESLREALRHNPDYDRARHHLSDLEKMTDKEYEKFLKEGPERLIHTEWRG